MLINVHHQIVVMCQKKTFVLRSNEYTCKLPKSENRHALSESAGTWICCWRRKCAL